MAQKIKPTLVIGGGNMGHSILTGFKKSGGAMGLVSLLDPLVDVDVAKELGLKALYRQLKDIPSEAEFGTIVLAVKPQIFATFESDWCKNLASTGKVVSIMAGVAAEHIRLSSGRSCAVVRCMPNLAAAIGKSANVAFTKSIEHKKEFEALFSGSGQVHWIDEEDKIHITTAISGSGPAYFFAFVEALAFAGKRAGLDEKFAMDLSIETMIGSAGLLAEYRSAESLRVSVSSKGGTTAAALAAFADNNALNLVVDGAVQAAIARSYALSS